MIKSCQRELLCEKGNPTSSDVSNISNMARTYFFLADMNEGNERQ
jgi:hypothetical protein